MVLKSNLIEDILPEDRDQLLVLLFLLCDSSSNSDVLSSHYNLLYIKGSFLQNALNIK